MRGSAAGPSLCSLLPEEQRSPSAAACSQPAGGCSSRRWSRGARPRSWGFDVLSLRCGRQVTLSMPLRGVGGTREGYECPAGEFGDGFVTGVSLVPVLLAQEQQSCCESARGASSCWLQQVWTCSGWRWGREPLGVACFLSACQGNKTFLSCCLVREGKNKESCNQEPHFNH